MNREQRILQALQEVFKPEYIQLKNDSAKHASHIEHLGSAAKTGETHYKLVIVSDLFTDLSRIERQRKINEVIQPEFALGLHAFEMKTYTVIEAQDLEIV